MKFIVLFGNILGLLFLMDSLVRMYVFNVFNEKFNFYCVQPQDINITYNQRSKIYTIMYEYNYNSNIYSGKGSVYEKLYHDKISDADEILICINETYPRYSYLKEFNFMSRILKMQLVFSLCYLCIINVLYFAARTRRSGEV